MDKTPGSSDSRDKTIGCGSDLGTVPITLNITTTTGGNFSVLVDVQNSIENLKKIIAQKLKVAKDRICLLHRERELQEGNLKDNGLVDGSKIILIPNVETGLLAQRPENTVMQALESLNDSQVNDFLSGKTPLNLSMRLGDHMMLIQLQLSTVNPSSPSHGNSRSRSTQRSNRSTNATATANSCTPTLTAHPTQTSRKVEAEAHNRYSSNSSVGVGSDSSSRLSSLSSADGSVMSSRNLSQGEELNSLFSKHDFESLQNIVKSLSIAQSSTSSSCTNQELRTSNCCPTTLNNSFNNDSLLEQSPIKSLSNLVSSPIKTTSLKSIPTTNHFPAETSNTSSGGRTASCSDPISAKLTSCLCKRLDNNSKNCEINQCQYRNEVLSFVESDMPERSMATSTPNVKLNSSSLLHKTANNPIGRSKHRHYQASSNNQKKSASGSGRARAPNDLAIPSTSTATETTTSEAVCDTEEPVSTINATDSRALAEASRNLTQTLRKLSKEVFTSKVDLSEETPRKNGSGAVIESMKNHGKGIYSGTFSGTLNPALQDRYGRPKRDISTVIHILNDLLSATPQYSRGARISFEPSAKTTVKQSASKHHSMSTSQDSCGKCLNGAKTSSVCAYGDCCGHYTSFSTTTMSTPGPDPCQRSSESHVSLCNCHELSPVASTSFMNSSSSSSDISATDSKNSCTCNFRAFPAEDGIAAKNICSKCSIEIENNKTKCKLDQLRLVMQQRKQRREARKLKGAPYGARVVSTTSNTSSSNNTATAAATATTIAPLASPSEVSPNHMVEEVDTAA